MRRPSAARDALRLGPLMQAGWADSSGVEGIPIVPACAGPEVFFAGRPAADWTADARTGCVPFNIAIRNNDRVVRNRTHVRYYDSSTRTTFTANEFWDNPPAAFEVAQRYRPGFCPNLYQSFSQNELEFHQFLCQKDSSKRREIFEALQIQVVKASKIPRSYGQNSMGHNFDSR
jgi:hypothetical protein